MTLVELSEMNRPSYLVLEKEILSYITLLHDFTLDKNPYNFDSLKFPAFWLSSLTN